MQEKTIKVGDRIAMRDVAPGTLIRDDVSAEARARRDALRAAVSEIETAIEKCHAAAAVCPSVEDAIECEARAGGLERALEILREAGVL